MALFREYTKEDQDLVVVIKGLYVTLADVDGTDSTDSILKAMAEALTSPTRTVTPTIVISLTEEIDSWLNGRELIRQNVYTDAEKAYNVAIGFNDENPATLYERARVLIASSKYDEALRDLDKVVAIAGKATLSTPTPSSSSTTTPVSLHTRRPTNTPATPGASITPTEVSPVSLTVSPTSSLTSTETPTPTATPMPASITSQFADRGQMISAVRNLIYGHPEMVLVLASAPDLKYPNLRDYGLVLTPTPTVPVTLPPTPSITTISLEPVTAQVEVGNTTSVQIMVGNVMNLYGAEVHLTFDPALLEVIDADLGRDGVQIQPGTFLSPDFVAKNSVEQANGRIAFAVAQMPPHEPVSGSGILAMITFRGIAVGSAVLDFSTTLPITPGILSDREGILIPATTQNGQVVVIEGGFPAETSTPANMPTPTNTPMPTPPRTVIPTPTPTRIVAPTTSTPYPPPVLTGNGIIDSNVTFRWQWSGTLDKDVWFAVRVGKSPDIPHSQTWTQQFEYTYSLCTLGGKPGEYNWEVAVCRGDPSAESCDRQLAVSDRSVFQFNGWNCD